jgi:hypothetical protein
MSIHNSNTSKSHNIGSSNDNNNTDIINEKDVSDGPVGNDDNKQRLDCTASKQTSRFNMQDYEFKDVLGT